MCQPASFAITEANKPLVISHSPCADGFTAAWACWLAHPDWEFYPAKHGDAPPDVKGRQVYLLDFSYKRAVMEQLAEEAASVVVLDHHKTAEAELAPLLADGSITGEFDMNHSGAYLAWRYFHPSTPVPLFVLFVEDRDLGRPWSKEGSMYRYTVPVNAVFFSYDYDFKR